MGKSKNRLVRKTSKKQKLYKMKGCSRTRKNYLGGNADISLAYTGKPIFSIPNPSLAYTGKGGSSNVATIPINTNASNPVYPNTGPVTNGVNTIFNNPVSQRGGCGCNMIGGKRKKCDAKHRDGCYCSVCKKSRMVGGSASTVGLVGQPWTSNSNDWPGADGISGNRNYLQQNLYNNGDPQTSMKNIGANPPFSNVKGGSKRKQKGGNLSNLMGQDLVNLGRQFQFGIGSAYNALAGYPSAVNPLPWKDQFPNRTILSHSTI